MVFFDRLHRHSSPQGFNAIDDCLRTGKGGDTRDVMCHRLTSYGYFIRFGFLPTRSIDHQIDLPILNLVDDIRSSFADLEYGLDRNSVIG